MRVVGTTALLRGADRYMATSKLPQMSAPMFRADRSAFIPLKAIKYLQVARLFYGGIILGLINLSPVLYQFRAIIFSPGLEPNLAVSVRGVSASYYRRLSIQPRGGRAMKSSVLKRSIIIAGHKTSVSLEDEFWNGLKQIAGGRDSTLSDLVAIIDADRQHANLSSAIRLFVLGYYRDQISDHQGEAQKRVAA
jgi:predicted DNA-binding ribbon-helix-helix protein